MYVRVLIGSKKGAFVLESDSERRDWRVRGPLCEHWPLTHVAADLADGTIYATGGNAWFGPAVWKSNDGGATWTHSSQGLAYPQGETPVQCAWVAHAAHGRLYVGVEPAGLFVSGDGGESFREVEGLRRHPSRPQWQPGGIGLVLHSIVSDPTDVRRLWVGISSVGVFYTEDGGETWSSAQFGHALRFFARGTALSRVRPVRAQPDARAGLLRPPLPAKSLRHVSQRRRRCVLAQHRERPPIELWLSCCGPSPRRRHAVLPAAQRRHQGPLSARRTCGGLALARWRRALG